MRCFNCTNSHKVLIFEQGSNKVMLRDADTGQESEFPIDKQDLLRFAAAVFNDTVGRLIQLDDSFKSLW